MRAANECAWHRSDHLEHWIEAAKKRLHRNVLAIALANKLARIAWGVLSGSRTFEVSKLQASCALQEVRFPAEVCEKMRRDGGLVFPAHANTGDPHGPLRPFR